jgi:hypothetical protein
MQPSLIIRRVTRVRTDVSEERIASIIRVTRIGELGTTVAVLATEARCTEPEEFLGSSGYGTGPTQPREDK